MAVVDVDVIVACQTYVQAKRLPGPGLENKVSGVGSSGSNTTAMPEGFSYLPLQFVAPVS